MMTKKKQKTKKLSVQKPIAKGKAMVVQTVHLPVPPVQVKTSKRKIFWVIFMLLLTGGVWCWLTFNVVDFFMPQRSVVVRPVRPRVKQVAPQVVPAEPEYPENVVAVVDHEPITVEEIQAFVKKVPQLAEVPFNQVYPKMLDLYINDKIVQLGAEEMMIPNDPEVQQAIEMSKNQIIAQAYLADALDQAITEQDLKKYYDEQAKAFQPQPEIHARHLLLDTKEQARDVLIQLQAGADFAALANQKSLDKNAKEGDLGYFTREMMIPEFAEAVFKMKKGELSGPVRTAFGWHIIEVLDKRMTTPPKFEDVKDQLRQAVMEQKVPEILNEQRAKRNVKIIRPTID